MPRAHDPLNILAAIIADAGSQVAAARKLKVSQQYLNDVMARRRRVSKRMAAKLGLEPHVTYRPLSGATAK